MKLNINTESESTVDNSFNAIAENLFYETTLVFNDHQYRFTDLEFYFCCKSHPDQYALRHTKPAGEFVAHTFGIDISLGNTANGYGGILIRGMLDENQSAVHKPQLMTELINAIRIGSNKIEFKQVPKTTDIPYFRTRRSGISEPGINGPIDGKFRNKTYRYILPVPAYFRSLKGKETILENADLSDAAKKDLLENLRKN